MANTYWLRHRGGNRRTASSPCTTTASKCRPDRRRKIPLTSLSASRSRTDPTYWENWRSLYTLTPITEKQIKFHVLKYKKETKVFLHFYKNETSPTCVMNHFLHVSWNIFYMCYETSPTTNKERKYSKFPQLSERFLGTSITRIRIQILFEDHLGPLSKLQSWVSFSALFECGYWSQPLSYKDRILEFNAKNEFKKWIILIARAMDFWDSLALQNKSALGCWIDQTQEQNCTVTTFIWKTVKKLFSFLFNFGMVHEQSLFRFRTWLCRSIGHL